jgi:hypothetical protein
MQIQEQFGRNEKLVTIVLRYNNPEYSSMNHYEESLKEFHNII